MYTIICIYILPCYKYSFHLNYEKAVSILSLVIWIYIDNNAYMHGYFVSKYSIHIHAYTITQTYIHIYAHIHMHTYTTYTTF